MSATTNSSDKELSADEEAPAGTDGEKIIPAPKEKKPFDSKAFWARIDALGDTPFPQIPRDDLRPELDDDISFD